MNAANTQMMQGVMYQMCISSVVEPVYSIGYDLVCIYMVLYLQSAVVMMDCLTVLSITSHTHKHNNNDANIITITNVWFAHASIPALTTTEMEQT